jgi:4-amino-4-deoxy-L-arabinose transferase-like glycosyltransferase
MLAKRGWLLLFLGIVAFYLWGLGLLPLVGPDEPRYAEVAREMLVRHDLITPTLGGIPWFEKPPLLYWLMMAGYRALGVTEYAARLGPAICGLLTAVFVYWIGKTLEKGSETDEAKVDESVGEGLGQDRSDLGRFSALFWLSSLGAIVFSRGASFDIVVTMTITGALGCFVVWHVRSEARRNENSDSQASPEQYGLLAGFYLFIGFSLLAKGLIGIVIPFGVIFAYFLIRREWPSRAFVKSLFWGIPLALAVAAVWFGPMTFRHGWKFIDQFLIQHHFARFVTDKYHHPAPFYFYLMVLTALSLPWTLYLGAAFLSTPRWSWRGSVSLDRLRVFVLCWIIVPIVFFSFSESKLTGYILPVLPAVALLVGERIRFFLFARRGDLLLRLTGLMLIGLGIAGGLYLHRHNFSIAETVLSATPLILVGAAGLMLPRWRKAILILIPLVMFVTSGIALIQVAPITARTESVRDLLATAAARGYGTVPVVQLHTVERTAEFYAADRMTYKTDGEPVKLEGVMQVADAARRSGGVVLCFVPREYEAQLLTYPHIQTEVIADNGRASLVVVRVR